MFPLTLVLASAVLALVLALVSRRGARRRVEQEQIEHARFARRRQRFLVGQLATGGRAPCASSRTLPPCEACREVQDDVDELRRRLRTSDEGTETAGTDRVALV